MNANILTKLAPAAVLLTVGLGGCATTATPDDDTAEESAAFSNNEFTCSDHLESPKERGFGVFVKAARAAGHPGFDRFVLEFAGNVVPHWSVHRMPSATFYYDGSGKELVLPGTSGLQLYVDATAWDFENEQSTFTGPGRFKPNSTNVLTEAANNGDFEGITSWALGLKQTSCYHVLELSNPPRLVIDIKTN